MQRASKLALACCKYPHMTSPRTLSLYTPNTDIPQVYGPDTRNPELCGDSLTYLAARLRMNSFIASKPPGIVSTKYLKVQAHARTTVLTQLQYGTQTENPKLLRASRTLLNPNQSLNSSFRLLSQYPYITPIEPQLYFIILDVQNWRERQS